MVTELETVKVEPYIPLGDIAKFVLRSPFTPVNNSSSMAPFLRLSDELKAKLKRARATHTRLYVPTWISETPSFETLIASYPFSIVDLVARQFRVVALNPNSAIELSDPTNLTVTDRDRLKLELGYPDLKLGDTIIARELYRGQTSSNYCDTINTMLAFDLIDLATDHGIYNPQDLDSYFQVHQAQLNGCPWGDQVRPSYRALSLGLSNLVSANSIDLLVEAGLLDPKNLEVFYEKVSGWLLAAWSRGAFEDRLPNQGVFN
jgi:hypothetical protein